MEREIRFDFPADIDHVVDVREALRKVCDRMGFTPHDASLVVTAVWEATLNAATHGSPRGKNDSVQVKITENEDSLCVDITSQDPAFDLPTDRPIFDPNSKRGRGLPIIYAFIDEVTLTRNADSVTLHLVKRLS